VRRELVLTGVGVVRAVTLGAAAAVTAADGPAAVTYGLAVVATVAQTLFRPAHSALLPALCTSPRQLTSANAVILTLGVAAGGLVTPLIVELLGIRPTLVGIGCSRRSPWRRAGRRCAGSTGACACATPTSRCCTA
jgi:hypothetical protein